MKIKCDFLSVFIGVASIVWLVCAGFIFFYNYLCLDHAEHLHASWLVWQGFVPYRDFFEHHNPLTWFVLSPVVAMFYNNPMIIYVSRVISFGLYCLIFVAFYKIAIEFLKVSKKSFCLASLLFLFVRDITSVVFELQPDSFMWASFLVGLYFYFKYLDKKQQKHLSISFVLFLISFLFLQKILPILGILGVYTLYLCYKKKVSIKNMLNALVLPLLIIAFFLIYLISTKSLEAYWFLNFDLNFYIPKFYGETSFAKYYEMSMFIPLTAVFLVHNFLGKRGRLYKNILVGVVYLDYILKIFTFAPYVQYFIFTNLVCSLIVADYVVNKWKLYRARVLLFVLCVLSVFFVMRVDYNKNFPVYFNIHKIYMTNTDKNDVILNTVPFYFNIYGKNASYFWFGMHNASIVANYLYNRREFIDINEIVKVHRPKFMPVMGFYNQMAVDNITIPDYYNHLLKLYDKVPNYNEGRENFAKMFFNKYPYLIDFQLIKNNYILMEGYPLFIRKDLLECDGENCAKLY